MESITTAAPAKRRNRGVILTDRLCEKRVVKRIKIYDRKCRGLHVSITTAGVATFFFKFTDRTIGKQRTVWLGVYNPETFRVDDARSKVYGLKAMDGEALAETFRDRKDKQAKHGLTVKAVLALYITWMSKDEKKEDGELRPRIESWEGRASQLNRFLVAEIGHKLAREVTNDDIAAIQHKILDGGFGIESLSNAHHFRKAASAFFRWAAQAGRRYVDRSPCHDLPKLRKLKPRKRVLTEAEIRIFWTRLDECTEWPIAARRALRFMLLTMLRSREVIGIHADELIGLTSAYPVVNVPLARVKKRRPIVQPLTSAAVAMVKEVNTKFIFSINGEAPLARSALHTALRGDGKSRRCPRIGICKKLGLPPFSPHDLRRTGASWTRHKLGLPLSKVALCLDHRAKVDDTGIPVPAVTEEHYAHASVDQEQRDKREVLDAWAAELRRIIGQPDEKAVDQDELRLAA
jgi:integrase